jgi:hypothetical protein
MFSLLKSEFSLEHIKSHRQLGQQKEYHLYLSPKRTVLCERVLEECGVYGDLKIGELRLDAVVMDPDLFSLELEDSFQSLFLVSLF